MQDTMRASAPPVTAAAERNPTVELFIVSFLTLFAEVAFIRWLSAETRVFGFYKNFALISCFLGLGAGATLGSGGRWARWFVPALAAFGLFVFLAAPQLAFLSPSSGEEYTWLPSSNGAGQLKFYAALIICFGLNTAVFYAGGQWVGAAFEKMPPLEAYGINLLGGFLGTLAFTAVSYLHMGPFVWFLVMLGLGVWRVWNDVPVRWLALAASVVTFAFLGLFAPPALWSPYYKVSVVPYLLPKSTGVWGSQINTNATYHLTALDLSQPYLDAHPEAAQSAAPLYYNLPYRFVHPKKVLVLGAGAGNDVAAALRNGAESVTAVEIDPVIAELGGRLHPEKPYSDPRVHLVVNDARAFLKGATDQYDLIVYGLLDSHTVVAAMSNVRLDNFMYTQESFERAKSLLTPQGMIALSFSSGFGESWWVLKRIHHMLEITFQRRPVALDIDYDRGYVFLAGPGEPHTLTEVDDQERAASAEEHLASVSPEIGEQTLTDDWPFMYLKRHRVPTEYFVMGGLVLALALVMVRNLTPGGLKGVDMRFFWLGAGFLLVEVRNLAELALLFGSTWVVNAFVICGVLVMAMVSNAIASRRAVNPNVAFVLLGLAVALSFFSPTHYLAGMSPAVKAVLGTALLSLPFAFSGLVFSSLFKQVKSPAAAYGANLLGAVLGGMLEHASLVLGIRALSVLALIIYALAFVSVRAMSTKTSSATGSATA